MNETALQDLLNKIRNTTKDFEHEQRASGVYIGLRVELKDNEIIVKAVAAGGFVTPGQNYIIGNGDREQIVYPASGGVIPPNESIYPMDAPLNIVIHASDEASSKAAADVFGDRLKEELENRTTRKGPPNDPLKDRKGI